MDTQNVKDANNPSGPVVMRGMKVRVDRDLCIGAATCVAIAPKVFLLDSQAKAIILQSAEEESEQNVLDAARGCPVAAIIIEDAQGNKIFPK